MFLIWRLFGTSDEPLELMIVALVMCRLVIKYTVCSVIFVYDLLCSFSFSFSLCLVLVLF